MANSENKQPDLQLPNNKKGKPDSSLYPTSAKYARRRKQRNIACIVTGVAATGVLILGIISFLGKVSGQFTIKMDPRVAPSTLKLFDKVDGSASELLTADGLANAQLTTADTVFDYVDGLKSDNELYGSHNFSKTKKTDSGEESTIDLALVFTFYAENISSNEDAIFDYKMTIDDYVSPTNSAVQPYTYLRVALYENLWKEDGTGSHDFTVYALESVNTNVAGDNRECLSTYKTNSEGRYSPYYTYDGNHGYCESFEDPYTIFNRQAITLKPLERMRFTAVCWLEGNDPDCMGSAPEGASFTFSMAFSAH